MGEVRVVNASPLITLAKVGRLDLLSRGGQQFVVPAQVADEVLAGGARAIAVRCVAPGLETGRVQMLELLLIDINILGVGSMREKEFQHRTHRGKETSAIHGAFSKLSGLVEAHRNTIPVVLRDDARWSPKPISGIRTAVKAIRTILEAAF